MAKDNNNEIVTKKTWEEFRESKMLWWCNRILHVFGWAITYEMDGDKVTNVYPSRVKFRGFSEESEREGFIGMTKYMMDNAEKLLGDCTDELNDEEALEPESKVKPEPDVDPTVENEYVVVDRFSDVTIKEPEFRKRLDALDDGRVTISDDEDIDGILLVHKTYIVDGDNFNILFSIFRDYDESTRIGFTIMFEMGFECCDPLYEKIYDVATIDDVVEKVNDIRSEYLDDDRNKRIIEKMVIKHDAQYDRKWS